MSPGLAGLSGEITNLQQLMVQQGLELPSISKDLSGNIYGNYVSLDATTTMLLHSKNMSIKSKRLGAAWDDKFLLKILRI